MLAEIKKKPGVLQQRGMFFHGSSVNVSGKALLFLGYSGAGKSTISQLLSERYPVIADDKVLVSRTNNGDWMMCDASSNFRGENDNRISYNYDQFPLFAVLRIFKSNSTQIVPISPKETCKHLMDAVFEIDFQWRLKDPKVRREWFKAAAQISKEIEGWHLTFLKDKSIINAVRDIFEKRFA